MQLLFLFCDDLKIFKVTIMNIYETIQILLPFIHYENLHADLT